MSSSAWTNHLSRVRTVELAHRKIPAAMKTRMMVMRKYNSTEHPTLFHKATDLGKVLNKDMRSFVGNEVSPYSDDETKSQHTDDSSGDEFVQHAGANGKGKAKTKEPSKAAKAVVRT
ncbi:hypothetical protein CONPUDRAFT_148159 [Coniophora puteana RWD-64-598 SS2]|uniref:Uncharacterized protein n=1 Tax=Coniophora puteana (strain RWD-64-598) TaxID=741705 RepID=A0A5M3N410_CONPW|nr:uncharacterized protein CONPUDRAFT_148159 [Coniophora puteana RWD-64-598 SS2]EIW86038.1 hypothetical protein CONPUDRAFT_148159 [Coniophora puteana RWD-64-598 SS2]